MAQTHKLPPAPLHFVLPQFLQRFARFAQFPYDIRYMIWDQAILSPGIHFLKFVEPPANPTHYASASVRAGGIGPLEVLLGSHAEAMQDTKSVAYSAILTAVFDDACADASYYVIRNGTLAQLGDSCNEARSLVKKALERPDNLILDNGLLVLLQRSSDVVCIDYPDMIHAIVLGKWADQLNLDQLAKIRRLAVRYHHEWDNGIVCRQCGQVHFGPGKHSFPRHVYEFASLFKNLEAFYFIDYLTLRKPPHSTSCQGHSEPRWRFASGINGRTYFEADLETCTTHTRVHETLTWLRNNYIIHCMRKSRGPSQPGAVRFGVLACEWDPDQKLVPAKRFAIKKAPVRKNQIRKRVSRFTPKTSSTIYDGPCAGHTKVDTLPVVFGNGGKSEFDFSLDYSTGAKHALTRSNSR
ncbi:hypothetical protein F4802DRAFT_425570 [Xylaria palmicola]|nr:hypothetical protein F4802DRAFT_425570 [Xylaria palmicola]